MNCVAVVGGGLAGLTAAYRLATHGFGVTLIEASPSWGGQVRTHREAGNLIELGAEGFSATGHEVRALCEELGLTDQILTQSLDRTLKLDAAGLSNLHAGEAGKVAGIQASPESFGAGLLTLRKGLGELVEGLVGKLTGTVHLLNQTMVHRVAPQGQGWLVEGSSQLELEVDAVVLAVPVPVTARLLKPLLGRVEALASLELRSSVTVSQAYSRNAVRHALDATGFVVTAAPEISALRACTFCSSKFPGRAAEGYCLVRAFFRPSGPEEVGVSDAAWTQRTTMALAPILGVEGEVHGSWVSRWPQSLPRFPLGFETDIVRLRASLLAADLEGLELAGASLEGGGVVGAVRSGEWVGKRVVASLPI